MKTLILFFGLLFCSAAVASAQEADKGIKQEGAHEAEYNADAQDRDHSGEIDSRQNGEAEDGGPAVDAGEQTNFGATVENVIISPAGTRTTSPSGSPGILLDDPSIPDGTNTRQSAKPNIAGSPVPGVSGTGGSDGTNSEIPENKVFSGKEQKSVPMNADKPAKQDKTQPKDKKGAQVDDMQKG